MDYCAVVFSHEVRTGLALIIGDEYVVVVVTLVEGNHGGANEPLAYRRSNQTFRVLVLMFSSAFWIRPPTIVSVLMWLPELYRPYVALFELSMAIEASICKLPLDWELLRLMFPLAV